MQTEILSYTINVGLIIAIFELIIFYIIKNTKGIGDIYGGGITGWIGLLTAAIIIKPSLEIQNVITLLVIILILIIYMLATRPDLRGNIFDKIPHVGKVFAFIVPAFLAFV